jgi:hypothetical protein
MESSDNSKIGAVSSEVLSSSKSATSIPFELNKLDLDLLAS